VTVEVRRAVLLAARPAKTAALREALRAARAATVAMDKVAEIERAANALGEMHNFSDSLGALRSETGMVEGWARYLREGAWIGE
jgi:hypothetical protein